MICGPLDEMSCKYVLIIISLTPSVNPAESHVYPISLKTKITIIKLLIFNGLTTNDITRYGVQCMGTGLYDMYATHGHTHARAHTHIRTMHAEIFDGHTFCR